MPAEVFIPPEFLKHVNLDKSLVEKVLSPVFHPLWYQQYAGYQEALQAVPPKSLSMVLVAFTGDSWCQYCQALKSEVFDTRAFGVWVFSNRHMLVHIDFPKPPAPPAPEDAGLLNQYQVTGFPTVIGLSANGTERGRVVGYAPGTGPTNWMEQFELATRPNIVSASGLAHAKIAA